MEYGAGAGLGGGGGTEGGCLQDRKGFLWAGFIENQMLRAEPEAHGLVRAPSFPGTTVGVASHDFPESPQGRFKSSRGRGRRS